MNPRRFRVRGYDVFLVQGWSNTQPVTSLLSSSLLPPYPSVFCSNTSSSQTALPAATLQPSPLPSQCLSSCFISFTTSSVFPELSLSSLHFSRSVMAVWLAGVQFCCLSSAARLSLRKERGPPADCTHYQTRRPHIRRLTALSLDYALQYKKGKQKGDTETKMSSICNQCLF